MQEMPTPAFAVPYAAPRLAKTMDEVTSRGQRRYAVRESFPSAKSHKTVDSQCSGYVVRFVECAFDVLIVLVAIESRRRSYACCWRRK